VSRSTRRRRSTFDVLLRPREGVFSKTSSRHLLYQRASTHELCSCYLLRRRSYRGSTAPGGGVNSASGRDSSGCARCVEYGPPARSTSVEDRINTRGGAPRSRPSVTALRCVSLGSKAPVTEGPTSAEGRTGLRLTALRAEWKPSVNAPT
jgi:hypothetical protein